ncbi:MAG: amidohydrolase family protein [Bryobacterales bacterium]|nr:amidohydrolase family protein [Bryobacterales bacterium]
MPDSLLLVRGARQLLTLRGPGHPRRGMELRDLGLIPHGAVLIRNGFIAEVGTSRRIENLAEVRRAREIDAHGRIVTPGFVDTLVRCQGDEEQLRAVAAAMSRHGTTSLEVRGGRKDLRTIRKTEDGPWNFVPTFGPLPIPTHAESGPEIWQTDLTWLRRHKAARYVTAPAAGRPALAAARALGFGCKVDAAGQSLPGAVSCALSLEAASLDAPDCACPESVRALAYSATVASLRLNSQGTLPARAWIDAGAAVSLGSGFGNGGPTLSLQGVIALACRELRLTPEEVLTLTTFNAACAIGLNARAGSLEPGKQADLLVLNCQDYRDIPYHFGVNHVHRTIKLGREVYREGSAGVWPAKD